MSKRPRMSTQRRRHIFFENNGICHYCRHKIDAYRDRWEIAHDDDFEISRRDSNPNCKPAHYDCHKEHTSTVTAKRVAKVKRQEAMYLGFKQPKTKPMDGSRNSRFRKRMDGTVEWRR